MIYGYDKTFHKVGHLDIETDQEGKVVAVWYRCMTLPFEQRPVNAERAGEMAALYKDNPPGRIMALDIEDRTDERGAYLAGDTVERLQEQLYGCRQLLERIETQLGTGTMV